MVQEAPNTSGKHLLDHVVTTCVEVILNRSQILGREAIDSDRGRRPQGQLRLARKETLEASGELFGGILRGLFWVSPGRSRLGREELTW
jgi:hypothetical protein